MSKIICHECGCRITGEIYKDEEGNPICIDCFNELFFTCDGCEQVFSRVDCNKVPSGNYCNDCIVDHLGEFEE